MSWQQTIRQARGALGLSPARAFVVGYSLAFIVVAAIAYYMKESTSGPGLTTLFRM